ncbi:hypothetical protein SteCoe_129 [Stentor coeruleus]|uniref:3-hydroxy-3-methylglutaryl coenzyme A reductase n=1 Tax=Stentor coeruleus TaxID=5963 RepID=A0A1R2D546_9CILI|nr:hypothetical protein SteCoe_129 [Stentor coeruleus]
MQRYLSDFHKKTIQERMQILQLLYPQINGSYTEGMDLKTADLMIENCIGKMNLPVGLGLNFLVNSKEYIVPMSTEEPSIIAAASAAAKFIKEHGGFTSSCTAPIMLGQIHILDIDPISFNQGIQEQKHFLIKQANTLYCPRMVSRGGGITDIKFQKLSQNTGVVDITVNVGEAMGANIVNTICEGLAQDIIAIFPCRVGLKILSNFCTERRVKTEFKIPIEKLKYKGVSGENIAKGFIESYDFARKSVYRACTHNKGILNGMQAVGVATGQDTRAIEAAAHTWASKSGTYQPLNEYKLEDSYLVGSMEIPMAVGTKGGALRTNPSYASSAYILGHPSSSELSMLIASIGLACNFAAIRAMVSEGIQKGHMGLHAKNIAIAAGVPNEIVQEVVEYMKQRGNISQQTALDYLAAHRLHAISRKRYKNTAFLNTFYANFPDSSPPLKLSIAFHCPKIHGIHIVIDKTPQNDAWKIHKVLFSRSSYTWVTSFLFMLNQVRFHPRLPRTNKELQIKMKLICIWINEISISIIGAWGSENSEKAFEAILDGNPTGLEKIVTGCPEYVEYGVYLELELWHILNYHLDAFVTAALPCSETLANRIRDEVRKVVFGNAKASKEKFTGFDELLRYRKKQMCASLMYLCDCLGEAKIDNELINELVQVGEVIETLSTARRDFSKVIKGEKMKPNLYLFWGDVYGSNPAKYFEYFNELVRNQSREFSPTQNSLIKKAESLLNVYYNIAPKL